MRTCPWLLVGSSPRWQRLLAWLAPRMTPTEAGRAAIDVIPAAQAVGRQRYASRVIVCWDLASEADRRERLSTMLRAATEPPHEGVLSYGIIDPRTPPAVPLELLRWGVTSLDRPETLVRQSRRVARFWLRGDLVGPLDQRR